MSELQLGLIGAGALVLLSVIAYNAVRDAKIRRKMPRAAPADSAAAVYAGDLVADESLFTEPALDDAAHDALAGDRAPMASALTDKGDTDSTDFLSSEVFPPFSSAPPLCIDSRIDCIVPLQITAPIAAEKVIPHALRLRHAGSKPILFEGKPANGAWQGLQSGERYQALRAAVQLANRSGPLNEVEFSEFVIGLQAVADTLDAGLDCPDMVDTVTTARALDAFAARCDVQLSLKLVSDSAPWSATYVQTIVSRDGLLLARDGMRFVKLDAQHQPVFTLQFGDTNFLRDDLTYQGSQTVTLALDVPLVNKNLMPFKLMCDYAASLSQCIGARIADDRLQTLSQPALLALEEQLTALYSKLEAAGLPAGSALARRLFND